MKTQKIQRRSKKEYPVLSGSTTQKSFLCVFFLRRKNKKKMFNLDEDKVECLLGITVSFLARQENRICFVLFLTSGYSGIYLSLTFGTTKFKQPE